MSGKRRITWLASYPKSGNTWLRAILSMLVLPDKGSLRVDINSLDISEHAAARWLVEHVAACPTSELTHGEVDLLRPAAYRAALHRKRGPVFFKVHDAYRFLDESEPLFPSDISDKVIYLVRNPLDVAVSFSSHLGIDIDQTIGLMAEDFCLASARSMVAAQTRQCLGSWSENARSWTDQQAIPVEVIRYEDLSSDTAGCVRRVADAVGLDVSRQDVAAAVEAAGFDRLQAMELKAGFREKAPTQDELFFRSGRVGGWREVLNKRQVDQLVADHQEMMDRFGYLDVL